MTMLEQRAGTEMAHAPTPMAAGVERLVSTVDSDILAGMAPDVGFVGLELSPHVELVGREPHNKRRTIGYSAVTLHDGELDTVSHAGNHDAAASDEIMTKWLLDTPRLCLQGLSRFPTPLLREIIGSVNETMRRPIVTLALIFMEVDGAGAGTRHVTLAVPDVLGDASASTKQVLTDLWPTQSVVRPRSGNQPLLEQLRNSVPAKKLAGLRIGDILFHATGAQLSRDVK
jgi:hypothetical protein